MPCILLYDSVWKCGPVGGNSWVDKIIRKKLVTWTKIGLWKVIWNKNAINRVIHHAKDSPIQSLGLREQRNILITKWNKNGWWTYIKQPNWCAGCLAIRRSILGVNGPEQMVYIPKHSINAPKGSIKKAQTTNSWMCNLGNDTGGQIKVHNRDE